MIACELLWKRQGVEGKILTTTMKDPRYSPTNLIELGWASGIYFFIILFYYCTEIHTLNLSGVLWMLRVCVVSTLLLGDT